jgi:hypothetical protein
MRMPTLRRISLAVALLAPLAGWTVYKATNSHSRLFKDARQLIAIARAQGKKDVNLLIAATANSTAAVAQKAERAGGVIRFRDDDVGYLRIRIPVDKADQIAEGDGIESVTVDPVDELGMRVTPDNHMRGESMGDRGKLSPQRDTIPWPPIWSDYPLRRPYSPLKDIDAADMRAKNPTYDGRGVTIALLDGNFDLLLPEFQTGYTVDGKPVHKVADYLNVTDPVDDSADVPQWVHMRDQVTATGGRVSYKGKTFTTPRDGTFRIGFLDERRWNDPSNAAYMAQDLDRNGNPRGDDGLFGVLWDESSNDVWVDTNRDLSFADQKAMTDYIKRGDIGKFGKDDPSTEARDEIGFTVQTNPKNKAISINVGIYQHATEIMGSVVGNKEPNGILEGVAPGARLVSVYYGGNGHGLIEGLITAFKHPLVDLIVLEQSVAIASGSYLLADAHHPISVIVQRLTQKYDKLLFVPGNNAPAFGYVAEDGAAPGAMSIGGYQARESYRMNLGVVPELEDNMHWGGLSHGPNGIGAIKPDVLAPSGQMGTDIGYVWRIPEQQKSGLYKLPAGYAVDGGTSTATPMAAGATSLVLSAAKQAGVKYDARKLKLAITSSARFIPTLAANQQGNGLIQVNKAFELLKSLQNVTPITITSRAPVRTKLAPLMHTPNEGVGLFEREGWSEGERATRNITFARTSGPAEPMEFTLSWQGNDGTFSAANSVSLPLNKPVELAVQVAPTGVGAHSAMLTLDHPSVPGHAYRVLNTVVVPHKLTAANNYTVTTTVDVPVMMDRSLFVDVPSGTAVLQFSGNGEGEVISLSAVSPEREIIRACPFPPRPGQPCIIENPIPGVWEINASMSDPAWSFKPERANPLKPVRTTVTMSVLGADIRAEGSVPENLQAGSAFDIPVRISNKFGSANPVGAPTALGSAFSASKTISRGEQHVYEINVPAGTAALRARVSNVADKNADLDIYLIDCTAGPPKPIVTPPEKDRGNKRPNIGPPNCSAREKDASLDAGGFVEVSDPTPGRWIVVVDAFGVAGGQTNYSYMDAFINPSMGSISMAGTSDQSGKSWSGKAHVWVASMPSSGRSLVLTLGAQDRAVKTGSGAPAALGTTVLLGGRKGAQATN